MHWYTRSCQPWKKCHILEKGYISARYLRSGVMCFSWRHSGFWLNSGIRKAKSNLWKVMLQLSKHKKNPPTSDSLTGLAYSGWVSSDSLFVQWLVENSDDWQSISHSHIILRWDMASIEDDWAFSVSYKVGNSLFMSVCLYMKFCPLCISHNTSRIHFIVMHIINQLRKVCCVLSFWKIPKFIFAKEECVLGKTLVTVPHYICT